MEKTTGRKKSLRAFWKRIEGQSLPVLVKWLLVAGGIGAVVGAVASGFGHTLIFANQLRAKHPWLALLLPVGGLVIVALYRALRHADDRGTNTIVASIQDGEEIPFKVAPLIFISTAITQLCGGSAGREGAALQLGGSIAKKLGKLIRLNEDSQRIAVMCGMSAGFSALFGTPLAAAVFSMEVISVGVMHYGALVPCVTASLIAHLVAGWLQVPPEVFPVSDVPELTLLGFGKVLALGAVAALVSIAFCVVLHKAEHWYEKYLKNQYLRIGLAGALVVGVSALLETDMFLGSGMGIIEEVFHTGDTPWYSFALKIVFTALTLGAGFKGGEIVPSFTVGAALGCTLAGVLDLPVPLAAACGMAGLFCGVTNSPITTLLICFELFGFGGMPYYLTAVSVSYMLSGRHSLYRKQKILFSKTAADYRAEN